MRAIRSLGYRTDIFIASFDSVVEDRGRYVLIKTPSNPGFIWGNYLLYPEPPDADASRPGHEGSWLDDHDRELGGFAETTLFGWDREDGARGDLDGFLARGFEVDTGAILTATKSSLVRPSRYNDDVVVEPLRTSASWDAAAVALVNAFAQRQLLIGSVKLLRDFVDRQLVRYRAMQDAGIGQWYGAYVDGQLAATLGLVRMNEIGRFQLVGTDPRFARQGVCSTLVYDVARRGFEEQHLDRLVIATDATYHASGVYASVGFRPTETLVALVRPHRPSPSAPPDPSVASDPPDPSDPPVPPRTPASS